MAERGPGHWLGLYAKGAAMGVAEVIPGVSGGTIAFITGIYPELLRTLAQLHPGALPVLWRQGIGYFWRVFNLNFLLVLGLGMLSSLVLLAQLLQHLLATVPILVWAFFFGLILASCIDIGRQNTLWHLATSGALGLVLGLGLALLAPAQQLEPGNLLLFVGGAIAITAWLLPGVSGSYLLLLMGLYPAFVAAVAGMQLAVLLVLGSGMLVGLMLFAQVLAWLLRHYYYPLLALLTGFMGGSLLTLWPWRTPRADGGQPVMPWIYARLTQDDPLLGWALACLLLGMLTVYLLTLVRQPASPAPAPGHESVT